MRAIHDDTFLSEILEAARSDPYAESPAYVRQTISGYDSSPSAIISWRSPFNLKMAIAMNKLRGAKLKGVEWMKVSKEKAAENRERILDEAARLFREKGVQGVGVDALGEAAGLTHGSLYSQFGSKDRLLAEAVGHAFSRFAAKFGAVKDADTYVSKYLSTEHRENPGSGCTVAAIGSEMPRQSEAVRHVFTDATKRSMARMAALLPRRRGREREDDALVMLAMMAGAMILARAVDDRKLSDRILSVSRAQLQRVA